MKMEATFRPAIDNQSMIDKLLTQKEGKKDKWKGGRERHRVTGISPWIYIFSFFFLDEYFVSFNTVLG